MSARMPLGPLRALAGSPAAIPALLMVGVFIALGAADGGYFQRSFLPAGLFAAALLGVGLLTIATRRAIPRAVLVAASLLAAYAAWSYLSVLWAGDPGAAWESANLALLYALAYTLFGLWPMRSGAAAAVVGAFGLGVAALGLVTLLRAAGTEDVSDLFISGRFIAPLGYANGNAALWFSAVPPCLYLAARREAWPPLRGLALGGAAILGGLALLAQSRGWVLAMPIALLIFLAIAPGRARNGAALLAVTTGILISLSPILAVFQGYGDDRALGPLLDTAVSRILVAAGALAVLGTLVALADRGVEVAPRSARRARRAAAAAIALAAVAAAVAGLAGLDDPAARASAAWNEFTTVSEPNTGPGDSARFGSAAGQNRFDFWRVALHQFEEHPVVGAGAGNFQDAYLREGRSVERPKAPHSLVVRVVSQTGTVGALLLAGAILAALLAGASAIRRRSGLAAATAGAAVATFAYWAVHGAVDWFYELPALTAPAFAMLGLSGALAPRNRLEHTRPGRSAIPVRGPVGLTLLAGAAASVAIGLGAPYLAQRQIDRAVEIWRQQPRAAFERLGRAAALNPLSSEPHATAAAIAVELERPYTAAMQFRELVERRPASAYSTLQLGALASQFGRPNEALELVRRAAELSPRDELIQESLRKLRGGRGLAADAIYRAALERRFALTGQE